MHLLSFPHHGEGAVHNSPNVSNYFRRIAREPRPERHDEQAQVARAVKGDREAIELLISANLAYVVHIAKDFRSRGVPFEDLIAEGCVGLLKAIRCYRAESGTRFITYAAFWVRKQILAAVSDQPHTIHVPRYAREHGYHNPRLLRLDVPEREDDALNLPDRLPHDNPLPLETAIENGRVRRLRRQLMQLQPRDRAVLAWRYGLGGQPEQTLSEIARRLGLSRERVRQIEVSALERLRNEDAQRAHLERKGGRRSDAKNMRL
jgi:RNA polymerase sigma factor (sigma-70 family)